MTKTNKTTTTRGARSIKTTIGDEAGLNRIAGVARGSLFSVPGGWAQIADMTIAMHDGRPAWSGTVVTGRIIRGEWRPGHKLTRDTGEEARDRAISGSLAVRFKTLVMERLGRFDYLADLPIV